MKRTKGRSQQGRSQHGRPPQEKQTEIADVLTFVSTKHPRLCAWAQIIKQFKCHRPAAQQALRALLGQAIVDGQIRSPETDQYGLVENSVSYVGIIDKVRPTMAYVSCAEQKEEFALEGRNLRHLFHGDEIRFGLLPLRSSATQKAYLIEVLQHGARKWVGHLEAMDADFSFHADSNRLHQSLIILKEDADSARAGDKVIVQPLTNQQPSDVYGRVCEVFGPAGVHEVEMHSILQEFGVSTRFSKHVLDEAEQIHAPKGDEPGRKDFRQVPCLTIDPENAQDFDDALSFQTSAEGLFEIGIHIADVSHYVRPKTALDQEAQRRGTSVYLVDRTVAMLPERLSNDICSLRTGVDRLAFSAVFTMDAEARIHSRWFGKSLISVQRRFTYDEVRTLISETEDHNTAPQEDIHKKDTEWYAILKQLDTLAQKMRQRRFESGAIRLHSLEFRFTLDKEGRPTHIEPKVQHFAHELIEEFMLLANREVAEYVHQKQLSKEPLFVYRAHEPPEMERLETFARFARQFGHSVRWTNDRIPAQINELLTQVKGRPEEPLLQQLAIRSMSKARYTTKEIPHFGLGFGRYTHFTSPIRRYPDLMVHRLLAQYLEGQTPKDEDPHEARCLKASELERNAIDTERASIKYKQAEFMQTAPKRSLYRYCKRRDKLGLLRYATA